jgi:hypothetical protein
MVLEYRHSFFAVYIYLNCPCTSKNVSAIVYENAHENMQNQDVVKHW